MPVENIFVEEVIPRVPKKKPVNPSPANKWVRVVGGPEGVNIQILIEDCLKRPVFTETEALEVARQFLEQNPDPQQIPAMAKKIGSQYVLYTIGEKELYIFIAWRCGLEIRIMLPQNKMLEPIRTNDSSQIPGFYVFGKK